MQSNTLNRFFSSFGLNHFTTDGPLKMALEYAGLAKSYFTILSDLGEYAGTTLLEVTDYIDHVSPPFLHMWDIMGNRLDWVQLNPAHRQLLEHLMSLGIVHRTFTENAPWQLHYAMGYLVADPGIFCTITLSNQTAYALNKYGDEITKKNYLPHFLENDGTKAWYGATFYTEIQGGSDLGANRAIAREKDGQWRIFSEDKYFASNAGVADGALVTARLEGSPEGAKGLALFFVPAFRKNGVQNYTIRRLKEKLATRAVPTGEVILENSEAYLLGKKETGIYQALEVLTLARLANAVGALGIARKAYLDAWLYTQKRTAFGQPLIRHPLVQKDLLEMETELEVLTILCFKSISIFNENWRQLPPFNNDYYYARLLIHLLKNMTAEMSAEVTRLAMELHGGIGFLEDFPIARWHREALITPIWEGGSNIQALDMLEAILKRQTHRILLDQIGQILGAIENPLYRDAIKERLEWLEKNIELILKMEGSDAQYYAKDLLTSLGECAAAAFAIDAGLQMAAKHKDFRFLKIADIYIHRHLLKSEIPLISLKNAEELIQITNPVNG